MKLVPDTSVIIDGRITEKIERGELDGASIIVPEAVVAELESQANAGREVGFSGLQELKRLGELSRERRIKLGYAGERPTLEQIKLASGGEIDALIRKVAVENAATFLTSDLVQAEVARAKGIEVEYLAPVKPEPRDLKVLGYFTKDTMSVHLKEGAIPMAKRGSVGKLRYVKLGDSSLTERELKDMAHELMEAAKKNPQGYVEIERRGATVLQIGDLRVAIARPPFSNGLEITAVRPIATVTLDDYKLQKELKERLSERQRGILIAGPPGAGKSTFAASVADFLSGAGYVVKTMESPRDLKVSPQVTQYTALEGSMVNTGDILLLVRPDYTIFDEMRRSRDFEVYADMRLAGVGMIGVVHATRAIDALQRLLGRIDLGVIPQVVDTILFIDKGRLERVFILRFTVKVPHGMVEADLARPVIEVLDFEQEMAEYEVYTYGEQVVVMPIEKRRPKSWKSIESRISREIAKLTDDYRVEMLSDTRAAVYVTGDTMGRVLGKGGRTVSRIESKLGVSLDVRLEEKESEEPRPEVVPALEESDKHLLVQLPDLVGKKVEVYVSDDFLFNATVGRRGDIRLTKGMPDTKRLLEARKKGEKIVARVLPE
ncbi:MAG: Flp pilus assembly complex ATPase component TadA [Euryarchaeota archaeon]|nr:Flp pilus assembly complex ATPase component TadA [Euryarchaeota archaeon]